MSRPGDGGTSGVSREAVEPGVIVGQWWHRTESGKVRCELCPRACTLRDGQRGFCFVREARDGRMVLSSYGRASGFCIDPVEKKPLNHFYPGSSILSFGTAGCNLGCRFCQNWDMSRARRADRLNEWASPEEVASAAARSGCKSVAFTYNEPIIFAEYAIDCAAACRDNDVQSVAVTAGYVTEKAREAFFPELDAVNMDLKAFSETFYRKYCFAHIDPVLETLRYIRHETDAWLEVTTLLIPDLNDSDREVGELCEWFAEHLGAEVPLHFTAFHPDFKLTDIPRTSPGTLARARQRATNAGIRHVYTGNVHDARGQSTYCAGCGELVIERDWYRLGRYAIDEKGNCQYCGRRVAGRFAASKGQWGARRQRLSL